MRVQCVSLCFVNSNKNSIKTEPRNFGGCLSIAKVNHRLKFRNGFCARSRKCGEWKTVSEVWIKWARKLISIVSERRKTNDYFTFCFLGEIFLPHFILFAVVCVHWTWTRTRECNVFGECCAARFFVSVSCEIGKSAWWSSKRVSVSHKWNWSQFQAPSSSSSSSCYTYLINHLWRTAISLSLSSILTRCAVCCCVYVDL